MLLQTEATARPVAPTTRLRAPLRFATFAWRMASALRASTRGEGPMAKYANVTSSRKGSSGIMVAGPGREKRHCPYGEDAMGESIRLDRERSSDSSETGLSFCISEPYL